MADSNAPVKVERELGSDGQPTGKYVFVVDDLHHYYYEEFDADRMERHLDGAGYTFREFRPMIAEMERQYTAAGHGQAGSESEAGRQARAGAGRRNGSD